MEKEAFFFFILEFIVKFAMIGGSFVEILLIEVEVVLVIDV